MTGFDTCVVVDWSARSAPSPATPAADAIWMAIATDAGVDCHYYRTRSAACFALEALFEQERAAGRRVVAGFDFPFAYPAGFGEIVTGSKDPFALWAWLADAIQDDDTNANNRFDVARQLNGMFPGVGPFWGCPAKDADTVLPAKGTERHGHGMAERRAVERGVPRAQSCWKLYTTGSVGSQALMGIPRLQAMRHRFGTDLSVAPFQTPDTAIVLVELFPSLLANDIAAQQAEDEIKDRAQVRVLAQVLSRLPAVDLNRLLSTGDQEEGWILGVGEETLMSAHASTPSPTPPPLRNDCFALPAGVDWIPVDTALAHLRDQLKPQTGVETVDLMHAAGRILSQDIVALRSNPPAANTAVDGYGFAGGREAGVHSLPLVQDRATAGSNPSPVPAGSAIRVLTGAALPKGVDTVVLQEDVTVDLGQVAFHGPVKPGANTRAAGEDVVDGTVILPNGRKLTPADLALAAATGHGSVSVREKLRVGVLSTGDELVPPGGNAGPGKIFDANRPMLLNLLSSWGMDAVDLGHVVDDRAALKTRLTGGAKQVHAILTSGGASAGDEDHVSALLRDAGAMEMWRIAVKPGRPLALGLWDGVPVFGLPGNPVAALVCSLIFARPALGELAGEGWSVTDGYLLPAGFQKKKKPGRREYLRARVRNGRVEIFKSEGSGRISGLSWAEGLVELPDHALEVQEGDLVTYLPFAEF